MLLLLPRDAASAVVDIQDAEGRCCFCNLEMLLLLLLIFKMRKRCKEMRPLRHQLHSTCIIHNNAPRVIIKKSELRLLTTLIREEAPPLTLPSAYRTVEAVRTYAESSRAIPEGPLDQES